MEYVQNHTDKPIPEPFSFTPEEKRLLHSLARRSHLTDYDDKHKRMPLSDEERATWDGFQARIRKGTLIRFAGREIPFAPGQIYEVPDGFAARLVALAPDRLKVLDWRQVRDLNNPPPHIHFQTVEEAEAITLAVTSSGDDELKNAPMLVTMKDGMMRFGDGAWQAIPKALPDVGSALGKGDN
jgi:hypothetical protein